VQTVRHVAGLLDFGDEHAGPDRVHGSGRNEHAVSPPRLEGVQHLVAPSAAERLREDRKIDARREAGVDPRSRLGIDDVPRLRLATVGPGQPGGTRIVGMNLDGKIPIGVEKLEEQRKARLGCLPPEQVGAVGLRQCAERHARVRTRRDHALIVTVIDEFPRLREVLAIGQPPSERRGESATAPQIPSIQRREDQRRQHGWTTRHPKDDLSDIPRSTRVGCAT
jgi:hypothetical protein